MKYEYQLNKSKFSYDDCVVQLKKKYLERVFVGAINNIEPNCISNICSEIKKTEISLKEFDINREDYIQYIKNAQYKTKYPNYYTDNFFEKSAEHYLCYRLLDLQKNDNFIDIASEHSPVGEIFSRLTGCNNYSQDIMFENGIHNNRIGGDASKIPVPDNFFKAAIATCSIEHFENGSDIGFMNEMERVLERDGKCIIVPLYLYIKASCQTDPQFSIPGNVTFDDEIDIYCAKDWGNRHGRFYSVNTLIERLVKPNKMMRFEIYLLKNPEAVDQSVYCRFFLVGVRI
jgi:hypothetical protein